MRFNHPHLATRVALVAALAILAAALAGCQGIAGTPQTAQVRFIDASPDAPALDIYQNSTAGLYNIGFGTVSSYIPLAPGGYTHAAFTTGAQQQLAAVHGAFALGAQYTVLIGNVVANLQMTVLKDQTAPTPAGQVGFRFLDQSTRTGAIDIYLLRSGLALTSVLPTVTGVRFGSNSGYIDVPSGTYSIVVLPAGTLPSGPSPPTYTGSQVSYPGGDARTIILIDQQAASAPGLQTITAEDYDSP